MRKITRDQFEFALFQGKVGAIKRSHLELFDYDPPTKRAAVVNVSGDKWSIFKMIALDVSGTRRFRAMHEFAMAVFGDPPWKRARAVTTYGRLGFLEKAVAAMPVAEPLEPYWFEVDREGRAKCRPDAVDFLEEGLEPPPPGDPVRVEMMSDRVRWRAAYDRFADDEARRRRDLEKALGRR